MTTHRHPEAFPKHLRPYLLPLPETRWEALFLLRCMSDHSLEKKERPSPEDPRRAELSRNGPVAA